MTSLVNINKYGFTEDDITELIGYLEQSPIVSKDLILKLRKLKLDIMKSKS